MPHSGSDTKHIYLVNSDPETVGKRRLEIKRFDNNLKEGQEALVSPDRLLESRSFKSTISECQIETIYAIKLTPKVKCLRFFK